MGKKLISFITVVCAHIYLVSRLQFFPYPELFIYPYLTNKGLIPYSQMLDQHFPGVMFFPINLATFGINTPFSMFILHSFIIIFIHVFVFFICYRFVKSYEKAYLANIFLLLWHPYLEGNVLWIDSFIPLLFLPSSFFFYRKKYSISGFLMGISLVLKQVVAPLAAIIGLYLLLTRKFPELKKFTLWFLIAPSIMLLYFIKIGAFSDFFYWTVTYNLTVFSELGRKFATTNEIIKVIIIFGPSLLLAVYSLLRKNEYSIFSTFLLGSLIFAYARFDFIHLQPALPFVAILATVYVSRLPQFFRTLLVIFYILGAVYLLAPYHSARASNEVKFFENQEYSIAAEIMKYADNNDPIFAMGVLPHIYYLTNTRPSGDIFIMQFPWFMVVAEDKILSGLLTEPPKVIIRDASATTAGMNLVGYMPKINEYVEQNYILVDKIGDTEILIPNESRN